MCPKSPKMKSPIKEPPLPQAGQSLRQMRDDLFDKVVLWIFLGVAVVSFAALEWFRKYCNMPPEPWIWTIIAVAAAGISAWRILKIRSELGNLSLGEKGERVVGQSLDDLRARGYVVIHDLPGDGWNIDHVIVGPGGVFAIETKTRMKPSGRPSEVVYDGETITVDGFAPERDPVIQVRAAARDVKQIIKRTSARDVQVQPVVLFPGWFTTQSGPRDIWVLNESAFPKWVENEPDTLSPDDVALIAEGLRMYVRNKAGGA